MEVHVLIDEGATHSFIHHCPLKNLKVKIKFSLDLKFVVAIGLEVYTKGKFQLQMQLQGTPINTEVFVLPVNGCEVSWLPTLGDIMWNL